MDIKYIVQNLCKKQKTTNVYELIDSLGIKILYHDVSPIRGYYYCKRKIKYIVLDYDLPTHIRMFVAAHELGHAVMHPKTCTPFLQSTFFSVDRLEIEANKFASELIIQDVNLMEHWEYTLDQWAAYYGLPREIIELRFK